MSKALGLGLLKKKADKAPADAVAEPVSSEVIYAQAVAAPGPRGDGKVKEIPPWQQGKRAVTVWVDEEQYLRLNEVSKVHRKPVRRLVFEALNMLLPAYDKLPVDDTEKD